MAESQNIEYKESWRDEYLKWVCGFANAQGGKIYLGCDDNGNVIGIKNSKKLLADGGLLSVISFHSLEDRLVKNFMRRSEKGIQPPRGLPVSEEEILKTRTFRTVGKAIYPSDEEISSNPRSRSAVLRVARRWGNGL